LTPPAPPLGVYIHWPYCARICPYCDFNVVRDRGRREEQAELVLAIADDLRAQAAITGPRRLVSIFFGGGTPSLMDPEAAGGLIALARSLWTPEPEVEVTLEANPTDAEAERFRAFADAGVGRLSLGVQALDDSSLGFLGRNHDADTARRAASAGAHIFDRLSLDLIYALPGQTAAAWREALERAVGLGAEHLSPYQLTIEPGTAFDRAVRRGRFAAVEPELGAELYELTQSVLEGLGFEAYEVSNHARGQAPRARHNLIYWRGQDYVGVGPGAHGRLTEAPDRRLATEAARGVGDYVARVRRTGVGWAVREQLEPAAIAEERLLNGLRTVEGVAWKDLAPLGLSPSEPRIGALAELRLIDWDIERLRTTMGGRLVLDRIISALAV
jgi:oxygen-independent coproporphyrinogen-3 oxidase